MYRVFGDRLVDNTDRQKFFESVKVRSNLANQNDLIAFENAEMSLA